LFRYYTVYKDSTHTKASAIKKKNHKWKVKTEAKKYQKELDLEIALKGLNDEDLTNEEVIVRNVDKDARMLYKSNKKMFRFKRL